jgi:HEAT repeat protein
VVLPIAVPPDTRTGVDGRLVLRWEPARAELPSTDLLCSIQAEVDAPGLGATKQAAELLLLRQPPPVTLHTKGSFFHPLEPIELTFRTVLSPAERAHTLATCSLSRECSDGQTRQWELLGDPVADLVGRRLVVSASHPGRYVFAVRANGASSEAVAWVIEDQDDLPWSGSPEPSVIAERAWVKRGESVTAVVAAPGRSAPVALTLRSGDAVVRRTIPLRTGAHTVRLRAEPHQEDPLAITLMQVCDGQPTMGRASIGVEPGGRVLEIAPRLAEVGGGESPVRYYRITTQDRLGEKVQSTVRLELTRPTFDFRFPISDFRFQPAIGNRQSAIPLGIRGRTLQWHAGKATSEQGEIEVSLRESSLRDAGAILIEALAPDGRSGIQLLPLHETRYAPGAHPGKTIRPRDRLEALVRHGLDDPMAEWLAERLLARHAELPGELPVLIASCPSDEDVAVLLRLALGHASVASAALEAALSRSDSAPPALLSLAGNHAAALLSTFERVLASDLDPRARAAAARELAKGLPDSLPALVRALGGDRDPLVRVAAASALGSGGQEALPELAAAADRETATSVRLALIDALKQVGGPAPAPALLRLAEDSHADVASAALRALVETGYGGADPRLFHILASGPPEAREEAARLLIRSGQPRAVGAALAAARSSPSEALVGALSGVRSRSVQAAATRWLTHEDPAIRLAAAECLATFEDGRPSPAMGSRSPAMGAALPVLRSFLNLDTPPEMADRAAAALIARHRESFLRKKRLPMSSDSVPELARLQRAGRLSSATQRAFFQAAGKADWPEAGPVLVATLRQGLSEPSRLRRPDERQLWLDALDAAAASPSVWAVPLDLPPLPPSPNSSPHAPALAALAAQDPAGFLEALWRCPLPDGLRRQSVALYARLQGAAAAPQLIALLESPALQAPAVRALIDLSAVDPLIAALRHRSPHTRAAAAAALGAIGIPHAESALHPLLRDDDPFVRAEAAWALAAITARPVVYTDHLGEPRQATP